jgi:L-alanine-DL-glutamate epimerase-like enolase superfamily enzyme
MRIVDFHIARFQFARDRVIGDSQVRADDAHVVALELIDEKGLTGLGFGQSLFVPLPPEAEIERIFRFEVWPTLEGERPLALVHRVARPRGGNHRAWTLPFHEAIQVALWDLAAKQAGMPLWQMLGARRDRIKAYASGLDFHLSDTDFVEFFGRADALGYTAFKIKVGHRDFERDLHRLDLLRKVVRADAQVMIDANEAWSPKEAVVKLERIRDAGYALLWVEDPTLRNDFEGLRHIRHNATWTALNTGEYLDASGKRALMEADAVDILNVHGQVTDVMRVGWLAADLGVPVSMGNTFLEVGVHCACALPDVEWLEYSFQNFDALVEQPIAIVDGIAMAPDRPGHGLELSEYARSELRRPDVLDRSELGAPPLAKPARISTAG